MSNNKLWVGVDPALPGSDETVVRILSRDKYLMAYLNRFEPEAEKKEIYIVARDLRTAYLYSGWHRHHIEDNPNIVFKYVGHENDLRGFENIDIYLVTTWRQHARAYEIRELVNILVQSGRATVKEVEW